MKFILTVLILLVSQSISQQTRREDVINDWIRRLREAPKGHSMSPSWSSKSKIPAIGVGTLPLQNEAGTRSTMHQPRQPFTNTEYHSRTSGPQQPSFAARPAHQHQAVRPQRHSSGPSQGFAPLRNRAFEAQSGGISPFSTEEIESSFPGFRAPNFEPPQRTNNFPNNRVQNNERFEESSLARNPPIRDHEDEEEYIDDGFEVEVRPVSQQKVRSGPRFRGSPRLKAHQEERPFLRQGHSIARPKRNQLLNLFRPKQSVQKYPISGPSAPRRQSTGISGRPEPLLDTFTRSDGPPRAISARTTTPRPIPTPGPEDFPAMPPPRPVAPPTHPTHPPAITHPPSHYLPSIHDQSNNLDSFKFDDDDYDVHDKRGEDNSGFFEVPDGFPSLETLGFEFESMKIRNRRSAEDLDESEQRFRRRQVYPRRQNPRYLGRNRRQHNENDYKSFQQNFWDDVDIDTGDFFTAQQGYAQRPRANTYQNYQPQSVKQVPQQPQQYSRYLNYNRDPYPQQSIQAYPQDGYFKDNSYNTYDVGQNEILGSGNFEVIRGGTFYDDDTYYYAYNNRKPYNTNSGNFLENFRDFADIKGEYEYTK